SAGGVLVSAAGASRLINLPLTLPCYRILPWPLRFAAFFVSAGGVLVSAVGASRLINTYR
ncbi:hypothetical protein, partial [Aeromonas hydrophila]|uniref:hypothetical protein n=1 Tax=Aeromonas hydrophila TaxID=644 RepID=UPI002B498283